MSDFNKRKVKNQAIVNFIYNIKDKLIAKERDYLSGDQSSNRASIILVRQAQRQLDKLHFVSVDDFGSVKQLIQLEKKFSKKHQLKGVSFKECQQYIPPRIYQRALMEVALEELATKADSLLARKHYRAGCVATTLLHRLRLLTDDYFVAKSINFNTYRQEALDAIEVSKPILEKHRGFKQLLGNLGLFLMTGGIGYLIIAAINKICTNRFFLFHQTHTSKQLDGLIQTVEYASKPLYRFN